MIEVERKFHLSENQKQGLLKGAVFLGEKEMTDIYYDRLNWALSMRDMWLRQRNGSFQLKVPLASAGSDGVDRYNETEDEAEIRSLISLPPGEGLAKDLGMGGFMPFCILKTKRKKYRKGGFVIDLDEAIGEDFSYAIAEVELMVDLEEQTDGAAASIDAFAREHALQLDDKIERKVLSYLKSQRPEHYRALVEAGIAYGS